MKRSILFVSLLASLAACSSGGGGSSDPAPGAAAATSPTPPSSSASDTATFTFPTAAGSVASGATVVGQSYGTTCYTGDAGACNAWSSSGTPAITAQGSGASTVTLTTDASGENYMTIDVSDPGGGGINHKFDLGSNTTPNSNANGMPANLYFIPDGAPDAEGNTYSLIYGGSAAGDTSLQYVTYGLWNAGSNGNGAYGAIASGTLTSTADMNTLAAENKQANYSGSVVGQASINGNTYQVTGTHTEAVMFGGANPGVTGSMALNATSEDGAVSGYWISPAYSAKISGNGFTGTITTAAASTPASVIASPAMSGPISGNFYGPIQNGNGPFNIGGTFTMSDGGTNGVMGAFAGHQ
jgi:hypothetical protein